MVTTGVGPPQASSGAEALQHWNQAPFDVIICDLAMPGMDGFEVLRRIRSADSNGAVSMAIALTASMIRGDKKRREMPYLPADAKIRTDRD